METRRVRLVCGGQGRGGDSSSHIAMVNLDPGQGPTKVSGTRFAVASDSSNQTRLGMVLLPTEAKDALELLVRSEQAGLL